MSSQYNILQTFFSRALPLYTPQAEKFLATANPDIFSEVSFRYTFSVEAMTKISHIIEDTAASSPGIADFHVSFQKISRLLPQQQRYANLGRFVRGLFVYGETDLPDSHLAFLPRAKFIDTAGTVLTDYWFVIAYGPGIGMTLLAEEIPSMAGQDRYYEGFYTFEQNVAYQLISILHKIYPAQVSAPIPPEALSQHELRPVA
ncbi:MAG: hypothetical protein Kow0031_09180 [Anaerolineae bacterium]